LAHVRLVVVGLVVTTAVIVTDMAAVELLIALFVPPVPVIVTVNGGVVVTVPDRVHVVVPLPPAVRMTETGLQATATPDGEEVDAMATAPANWKRAAP